MCAQPNRDNPRENLLYRLYWIEGLNIYQIAGKLKQHPSTIHGFMVRHNIPLRTASEARIGKHYSARTEWEKGCSAPLTAFRLEHIPWNKDKVGVYNHEVLKRMSESQKGHHAVKGRHLSNETREKISTALLGRIPPNKGKQTSIETRNKLSIAHYGKKFTFQHREHISETHKRRGTPLPEERVKMIKGRCKRPTNPELVMNGLLEFYSPGNWKYVGNGQFIIGGYCPDFININGQKKVLEVFGDYWHRDENPQERIDLFKGFGFDTLVIWEGELKNRQKVVTKILEFVGREK